MEKPRYIKIPRDFFKDMKFKIDVPKRCEMCFLCCCGYTECRDPECNKKAPHK